MIGGAYAVYRKVLVDALPDGLEVFRVGTLESIAQWVQERIGTPQQASAVRLVLPELTQGGTVSTYACTVYLVSPTPDDLVALIDPLLEAVTPDRGKIHPFSSPRTRNAEGLAYTAAAVTFQLKL